jgi:dynein light chain roadblock-type
MAQSTTSESLDFMADKLQRLSNKEGVKAALVLDRMTGAVLTTTGDIASLMPMDTQARADADDVGGGGGGGGTTSEASNATAPKEEHEPMTVLGPSVDGSLQDQMSGSNDIELFASIVWQFLAVAGTVITKMDSEDELRLLRLRSKKQEIVVVPDLKYVLIVVHETSPA